LSSQPPANPNKDDIQTSFSIIEKPESLSSFVGFKISLSGFFVKNKHAKNDVSGSSLHKFFNFYATGVNKKLLRRLPKMIY